MIEFRCERTPFAPQIQIAILDVTDGGRLLAAAEGLTMKVVEPGEYVEPCVRAPLQSGQMLMDELWRCGLRPSEGAGSAGSLAATERHLKDMQEIAMSSFKRLLEK